MNRQESARKLNDLLNRRRNQRNRRYQRLVQAGICTACEKSPARPGRTQCRQCSDAGRAKRGDRRERLANGRRRVREAAVARGAQHEGSGFEVCGPNCLACRREREDIERRLAAGLLPPVVSAA